MHISWFNFYGIMKIILIKKLGKYGILPSKIKKKIQNYESRVVIKSRYETFNKIVSKGWCSANDCVASILVTFTFERCGIAANELRDVVNCKLREDWFSTISIGGHYVIQSKYTGLIYDLVSTKGLKRTEKNLLAYSSYSLELLEYESTKYNLLKNYTFDYFGEILN